MFHQSKVDSEGEARDNMKQDVSDGLLHSKDIHRKCISREQETGDAGLNLSSGSAMVDDVQVSTSGAGRPISAEIDQSEVRHTFFF